MGALDRFLRNRADTAAQAASDAAMQRVRAAQRLLAEEREGVDPNAAAGLSASAGVRQAATGQLPGDGDPARSVSADAAWDRSARSGDVAPLLRARSTPVAELVADDLEQILSEALPVEFDEAAVSGVNEAAFESIQERIAAVSGGSDTGREAVRILLARYGIPEDAPPAVLAERLAGGIAGQRTALEVGPQQSVRSAGGGYTSMGLPAEGRWRYGTTPPNVIDSRLERVADNPFPERPTSLEGFPEADELFDPVGVNEEFRIPRFEYDPLGRLKVDGDGNPVPRLDPEERPTFETVSRRRLLPQRTVSGTPEIIPAGEFTTIGTRRKGSDGNRSAEQVEFVLDRGDGTYQLSTVGQDGRYKNEIVSEGELGRRMIDSGYQRLAGPELGFTVKAPTESEAESLGRMLFDSMQPGAATPQQLAEVVRRIDALGPVFDGALVDRALQAAGFQQPGGELAAGRQILASARESLAADPPAPAAPAARPQPAPMPATIEVRPPAAFASRGAGVRDVVGDPVRQALSMISFKPSPSQATVDAVSGPADAVSFLGPDGAPITAGGGAGFTVFGDAPPVSLYPPDGQKLRDGLIGGTFETDPVAGIVVDSTQVGGDAGFGSTFDTGTRPGAVPVTMSSSVSMPDRLDLLGKLSDVATPATPVLNFRATPGSWADQTAQGTIDVGGVDTVRPLDPGAVDAASQQYRELSNRQAAVKAALGTFADEPTGDLAEVWRRMEELQEVEPAFRDLDVTEQFEMASLGYDELRALSDDLDAEAADSLNPNTFTQSASVSGPRGGSVFSTAQDLQPIQTTMDRASRVRQAADPSAPAPAPAANASEVAFGIDRTGRPTATNRRAAEARAATLQARADANRRAGTLLYKAADMYNPQPARAGEAPPLPSTPEQVAQYVRGSEEFFRLPAADKQAVLDAIASPDATNALLDSIDVQQKALRKELAGIAPTGRASEPDAPAAPDLDTPDNVTDIPEQRAEAEAELAESDANADFYNEQRNNVGAGRPMSLRRIQNIVRNALGIKSRERLPLAFSDYDSRFGRRVSRSDIERLNTVRGFINKYDSMSDAEYAQLRVRNTDLPPTRQENVDRLGAEFKKLARQVARDTVQDADSSGANQARLVQNLLSDNPQTRLNAVRELFAVPGLRNAAGERAGEDGLQVLEMLARDPAFGSVENVLYDVLSRDQSVTNPELSRAPVVDESGAALADRSRDQGTDGEFGEVESAPKRDASSRSVPSFAGMGPESLREVAKRLAEDVGPAEGRQLTPAKSAGALLYSVREGDGITPAFFPAPDEPAGGSTRPSFIDRLRGYLPFLRRQADEAPAGPPEVRRQGLDTAEQEIAAATTPEEMNAVLARINRVREQALAQLDDTSDPPVVDGSGVERSARQQIIEKADALTESWRRRMERMQVAGESAVQDGGGIELGLRIEADNAYAQAFAEARAATSNLREAMRAGKRARDAVLSSGGRQFSAEEADALAVEGGEAGSVLKPMTKAQAESDLNFGTAARSAPQSSAAGAEAGFNPAGYTVVFRDPEALTTLGMYERDQLLKAIDGRIAKAEADAAARRPAATGSENVQPATLASLKAERARISTPKITVLEDGRVSVQFAPGLDPIVGELLRPVETDFGPVPPVFSGENMVGVDFDQSGAPSLRKKGNVIDRRGQDPSFDPVPEIAGSAATVVATPRIELPPGYRWSESGVATPAAAAAAKPDSEILEEFARPVRADDGPDGESSIRETYPYDSEDGDVSTDEERITGDAEDAEYEAEQARKAQKGKDGVTVKRAVAGTGAALAAFGTGSAIPTGGLNALIGAGAVGGLGFAPMASAYGETAPAAAGGDINNSVEPTGSQVRQARRRLSYLTSQNPLPY